MTQTKIKMNKKKKEKKRKKNRKYNMMITMMMAERKCFDSSRFYLF